MNVDQVIDMSFLRMMDANKVAITGPRFAQVWPAILVSMHIEPLPGNMQRLSRSFMKAASDALSVRSVAARIGASTRAVYSVFGSKEQLLPAVGVAFHSALLERNDPLACENFTCPERGGKILRVQPVAEIAGSLGGCMTTATQPGPPQPLRAPPALAKSPTNT